MPTFPPSVTMILGIDPGVESGFALVVDGKLQTAGTVKMNKLGVAGMWQVMRSWEAAMAANGFPVSELSDQTVKILAIEDPADGGYFKDASHFAMAKLHVSVGLWVAFMGHYGWTPKPIKVQTWYPRHGAKPLPKPEAVKWLRSQAGEKAKLLSTSHATMAFGVARAIGFREGIIVR